MATAEFTASPELLDLPATKAAAQIALAYLDEATAAALRLADRSDEEALHDFRVAIRRLRVTLRAYPAVQDTLSRKQRRRLRKLARYTNPARNAEVQVAWFRDRKTRFTREQRTELDRVRTRLRARRRRELTGAQRKLQRWFAKLERKLRRRLEAVQHVPANREAPFRTALAASVARQAGELNASLRAVRPGAPAADVHATRIAAKRLRYLLEPVAVGVAGGADAVERLKGLQGMLGALTDGHELEIALEEESRHGDAVTAALKVLQAEQAEVFAKLGQDWSQAGPQLQQQVRTITQQLRPSAKTPPSMRQPTRRRREATV